MADQEKDTETVPDVEQFDATLKKKKKKSGKKVEFDGDVVAGGSDGDAAEGGEKADAGDDISFGDLKKRKKKKSALKKADGDEEGGDGTATAVDEVESSMEQMFIDLKKKKKKKSSSSALGESTTAGDADDVGDVAMTGTSQDELGEGAAAAADENMVTSLTLEEEGKESWLESDRDYTYHELLARVFRIIHQANPDFSVDKKRYKMVPPQMGRDGKKSIFANINDICRRMNRSMDHLISYLYAELGTQGSVDGSQRLIIKGKFTQKQIETMLSGYIGEYVTCKTCRSPETILERENRLLFLKCNACGSSRAVAAVKGGFRAQTEKRRLLRQQQG